MDMAAVMKPAASKMVTHFGEQIRELARCDIPQTEFSDPRRVNYKAPDVELVRCKIGGCMAPPTRCSIYLTNSEP